MQLQQENLLNDKEMIKLSYVLQKEEIASLYPNAIFSKENQTLEEYIDYLLLRKLEIPYMRLRNGYIKECLLYMYNLENPYFLSVTKELYPYIANKFGTKTTRVERTIRYTIGEQKRFLESSPDVRREILALPEEFVPSNFYFLANLLDYIKLHYFDSLAMELTEEEKVKFLSKLNNNNNILKLLQDHEIRKKIQYFLYKDLGHFRFQTTQTQQILIDYIISYIRHGEKYFDGSFFANPEIVNKWNIDTRKYFGNLDFKVGSIRFTINNSFANSNPEIFSEIFGSREERPSAKQYILKVGNYIKTHNII